MVTSYSDAELAAMGTLLTRESGGVAPDMDFVAEKLLGALSAIGLVLDGSEENAIWHELTDARPGPKEKWAALVRCAAAPNPVSVARTESTITSDVNAMLRNRWAPRWRREGRTVEPNLRDLAWDSLSGDEQAELRQMLESLALYQRGFVPRRGSPRLRFLDDALVAVADVFLRFGGDTARDWRDLPYGVETRFIRFAALALDPLNPEAEQEDVPSAGRERTESVSPEALSARWHRLIEAERNSQEDDETDQTA